MLLCWINDVSSRPVAGKRWPIIDVDEQTLSDYAGLFRTAAAWGFNGITIWGLYVDHAWPVDLADAATPQRRKIIDKLIASAHANGIRVFTGLGVYGWGFEEIIRRHPEVARDEGRMVWGRFRPENGKVMCYQSPHAREWMHRIIDFAAERMGVDGFGLQSADQGRCYCRDCRLMSDMEHHALLNDEAASYIRKRWPDKGISVSGWGMRFDRDEDWPHLRAMGRHLDYMTDVQDQSAARGEDYRRKLISQLDCDFGSLGRVVVTPPQRWARDRWFLPHALLTGENIRRLAADGGRAFELFAGPLNNPQYAIMTRFVGRMLAAPDETVAAALAAAVDDVLAPAPGALDEIVQWMRRAEEAYFNRAGELKGEFDFEPLEGVQAGEPIYLSRLGDALPDYARDLDVLREQFAQLAGECRDREEAQLVLRCLDDARNDARSVLDAAGQA
jgi:hypothetical protein